MWTLKAFDTISLGEDTLNNFINTREVNVVRSVVYRTVVIMPISESYKADLSKILGILHND